MTEAADKQENGSAAGAAPLMAGRKPAPASRADEIAADVAKRTHIWDAYDQGRWAHARGEARANNPHYHPALPWHVNVGDWFRGWDAEAERAAAVARKIAALNAEIASMRRAAISSAKGA